jgi:hypothetical protein
MTILRPSSTSLLPVCLLLLGVLLAVPACAPAGETALSARGPITFDDIQAANISGSAFEVVRSLRPEWLNLRGRTDIRSLENGGAEEGIRIYLDGTRLGETAGALSSIPVQNIGRIERLNAQEATTRYGSGHLHGAIVVTSR